MVLGDEIVATKTSISRVRDGAELGVNVYSIFIEFEDEGESMEILIRYRHTCGDKNV